MYPTRGAFDPLKEPPVDCPIVGLVLPLATAVDDVAFDVDCTPFKYKRKSVPFLTRAT